MPPEPQSDDPPKPQSDASPEPKTGSCEDPGGSPEPEKGPCEDPSETKMTKHDATYTGARLKKTKPHLYNLIEQSLIEGLTINAIAKKCKVAHKTVKGILARDFPADFQRDRAKLRYREVLAEGLDKLSDEIGDLKTNQLPITLGIVQDKLNTLEGQPTYITETRKAPSIDEFNEFVERLASAAIKPKPIEVKSGP